MIRDWERHTCSPREQRILGALAEALYLVAGDHTTEVVDAVQVWLGVPHTTLRCGFRALLWSLELSPVRWGKRRLSTLPLEERVLFLERLERNGSIALVTWKAILGMAYFGTLQGALRMSLRLATIVPFPRRGGRNEEAAS